MYKKPNYDIQAGKRIRISKCQHLQVEKFQSHSRQTQKGSRLLRSTNRVLSGGGVAVDAGENKKRGIRSDCSNTSDNYNDYCLGDCQMAILI